MISRLHTTSAIPHHMYMPDQFVPQDHTRVHLTRVYQIGES